jgi:hypothetical protein
MAVCNGLAGLAYPNIIFVITPCGQMASVPIGTTPFLPENWQHAGEFRAKNFPHAR